MPRSRSCDIEFHDPALEARIQRQIRAIGAASAEKALRHLLETQEEQDRRLLGGSLRPRFCKGQLGPELFFCYSEPLLHAYALGGSTFTLRPRMFISNTRGPWRNISGPLCPSKYMGSRRVPLQHPLAQLFQRAAESLTTSLGDSSIDAYQSTVHLFLTYLLITHRSVR